MTTDLADTHSHPTGTRRPQEPVPPYPYSAEDVVFFNRQAGIHLAGTLTLPPGQEPHPAVLLLCGSGPGDRDEAIAGHRPFLILADYLTRAGIAVLRYDKRGVGQSSGNPDIWQSTFQDFAQDALAGVAYLQTRAEIDSDAIGLIGHSEGGKVAPLAAIQSDTIAFVVILASSALPEETIILSQMEAIGRANGAPADVVAGVVRNHRLVFDLLRAEPDTNAARSKLMQLFQELEPGKSEQEIAREWGGFLTPFFQFGLTYDARATLEQLHCPVLVLHGEKDLLVIPAINLPSIREALATASNQDVTIIELPDLNHMFQPCETGSPEEYGRIEQTFSPKAMHLIGDWILSRVAKPR